MKGRLCTEGMMQRCVSHHLSSSSRQPRYFFGFALMSNKVSLRTLC